MIEKILTKVIKNKFRTDFLCNIISLALISLTGILINIIIGNHYGSSGLGFYNFVFSIYILFSTVSIFGLKSSVIKYTAQYNNQPGIRESSLKAAIIVTTLISLLVYLMYSVLNNLNIFQDPDRYMITILTALPLFSINETIFGYTNGLRKMKTYAAARVLRWVLILLGVGINTILNNNLRTLFLSHLYAEVALLIFFILYYRRILFQVKLNVYPWIKTHLLFGFKIFTTDLVTQLDTRLSIILMGLMLSAKELGVFSFASSISSGLIMVPGIIALNFNPIIADLWVNNKQKLVEYSKTVKKWTLMISTPIYVFSALIYPLLVKLLMREDSYVQSIPVLYILLIGNMFLTTTKWAGGFLTMIGYPEEQLKLRSLILIFNLISNIIFINLIGLLGAAVASTMTSLLLSFVLNKFIKSKMKI